MLSDGALAALAQADPASARRVRAALCRWDSVEVDFKDSRQRMGGHRFSSIARDTLITILQDRCRALGVVLEHDAEVDDGHALAAHWGADLLVAADGYRSGVRRRHPQGFGAQVEPGRCRYLWLGTTRPLDTFAFVFMPTRYGWFQAHAYPFGDGLSTFIIETRDETWRAAGLQAMSHSAVLAWCEALFRPWLGGHRLLAGTQDARRWRRFGVLACARWIQPLALAGGRRIPVVLMGDAAHTAHFSVGSGTHLAMEDAIALQDAVRAPGADLWQALQRYEHTRREQTVRLRNAGRNSMQWFESVDWHARLAPEQFAYSLITRSQRISHENLRLRDPQWLASYEVWLARQVSAALPDAASVTAGLPMLLPYQARSVRLRNRIVVSPMAMYSAREGVPGDFHLVHLGSRAMGGAGLVMVEMTAVSADARITPACPGLWTDEQAAAFRRIADFVHAHSDACLGIQLGHAGRKGAARPGWEVADQPLAQGAWPLFSASAIPWMEGVSAVPQAMTAAHMAAVTADFVAATQRAAQAGFDWLELHCAHGYLLSSFLSPLTNRRGDAYGGPLENRLRYPLEVFTAVRAAWPAHLPRSVRISAHDWVAGGTVPEDAVEMARRFHAAGADMITCSSGQVSAAQKPRYGRMYQTPFADQVRNQAGVPTMAVGAIQDADQVNSILAAGRADLCALARPHLADAAWTLRESARLGVTGMDWPRQYRAGQRQLERAQACHSVQEQES